MKTVLDVVAAWTALDVVLIAAWHLAHVRSRRLGTRIALSGSASGLAPKPVTQRVYTLAPQAPVRDTQPNLVQAGRG